MNQSTDFTLVSYCVTRHLARSERAAMAKRCLAAVCFALRLLRPSLVVMGIDPTFPPPARRTLQKSATIVLIRKSLLDPMPPALHRRLYDRKCGLEVAGDASRAEAAAASRIHLYGFDRFLVLQKAYAMKPAAQPVLWLDPDALAVSIAAARPPRSLGACEIAGTNRRNACAAAACEKAWGQQPCEPDAPRPTLAGMRSSGAFNNDGVAWLPTSPHLVDAMVARLFAGNFSFYRTFPPGARTTFKDQDLFAYHLTHTPGCAFVDLGPCAFWRAKGKRRCREGAPLMIHTTWWFKAIGVIERAVGSLAAGSCASLPPRLSSEEVEQLCTHSPADQSEICRRIAQPE